MKYSVPTLRFPNFVTKEPWMSWDVSEFRPVPSLHIQLGNITSVCIFFTSSGNSSRTRWLIKTDRSRVTYGEYSGVGAWILLYLFHSSMADTHLYLPLSTTRNDDITYRHCGLQLGENEVGVSIFLDILGHFTVFIVNHCYRVFYHRTVLVHFKPFYYEPANNKMLTIYVSKS
jgi:hypothetical protein